MDILDRLKQETRLYSEVKVDLQCLLILADYNLLNEEGGFIDWIFDPLETDISSVFLFGSEELNRLQIEETNDELARSEFPVRIGTDIFKNEVVILTLDPTFDYCNHELLKVTDVPRKDVQVFVASTETPNISDNLFQFLKEFPCVEIW
jgi:hypothetical protein